MGVPGIVTAVSVRMESTMPSMTAISLSTVARAAAVAALFVPRMNRFSLEKCATTSPTTLLELTVPVVMTTW